MRDFLLGKHNDMLDIEEIDVGMDDSEFWEFSYCLVYSNPDSHKIMRFLNKTEALSLLMKLTKTISFDKTFSNKKRRKFEAKVF